MSLNVSKGNMYEFVTHTWNTIKGQCPHDCSYCYMKRWGKQNPLRLDKKEFKTDLGSGNFIFVGSSCDMFADAIPDEWINETLEHCAKFDSRYLFQSKNPGRMNLWLRLATQRGQLDCIVCTTIETNRIYPEVMRKSPLPASRAKWMRADNVMPHYVTIEPIMAFDLEPMVDLIRQCNPVQVNIGADSGNNNLPEPSIEKVSELIAALSEFTVISKKRNLGRLQPW
jgi:DNA repair photolyase